MCSTAEKIETIALSRTSGAMGQFVEYAPGKYRVTADGLTVLVRCGVHGWHVSFKGFEAIDGELIQAAKMALEGGKPIQVTRHSDLAGDLDAWLDRISGHPAG